MKKRDFNYESLYAEIARSIEDQARVRLMYEKPRKQVDEYLSGQVPVLSSNALELLAAYWMRKAIVTCPRELEEARKALIQAFCWRLCGLRNRWRGMEEAARNGTWHGTVEQSYHVSMLLALAIVCGKAEYAAEIVSALVNGFALDVLGATNSAPLGEFLIQSYDRWQGIENSRTLGVTLEEHPYGALIAALDKRDSGSMGDALYSACDFHVSRSKTSTSRTTYEFDDFSYRIYPAEIFGFLRVCQDLEFAFDRPKHPVLDTCLIELESPKEFEEDSLLTGTMQRLSPIAR